MLMTCTECNQHTDCRLSKESDNNDIICGECGKIVSNVSNYTKKGMISSRDFWPEKKQAFSMDCNICKKRTPTILSKDKQKALCSECKEPKKITVFMLSTLKTINEQNER